MAVTSRPNLRLSSATLGQLANPGFASAAGAAIGASMLAPERRENERIGRAAEEETLDLLRQAQIAQEQGDTGMLTGVSNRLSELLPTVKDEEIRDTISDAMGVVNSRRTATQTQQQTNQATALIRVEDELAAMDTQMGPRDDTQEQVYQSLQNRAKNLRGNAKVVVEADTIRFNSKVTENTRRATLRDAAVLDVENTLASLEPGSEEYQAVVKEAEAAGLGRGVKNDVKKRTEAENLRLTVKEQRSKVGPLSQAELQDAASMGLTFPDGADDATLRQIYNTAFETRAEKEAAINMRNISTPSEPRGKALAMSALETIRDRGDFTDILYDDIASKIDDLSDEEIKEIESLVEGLSENEIPGAVSGWLQNEYPEAFKRSEDQFEANQEEIRKLNEAVDSVLADRNLTRETASPAQIERATRDARAAQRAIEREMRVGPPAEPGVEGRRNRRGPPEAGTDRPRGGRTRGPSGLSLEERLFGERETSVGGRMNRGAR